MIIRFGLQGVQGETGLIGYTGIIGLQGFTGLPGNQGETGIQIIMNQMIVDQVDNIVSSAPTGIESLNYLPITGLKTTLTLDRPSKILSLLSLKYKSSSVGSHTISYLLQSNGETGPCFSDYLDDTRERSEMIYHITQNLPVGTHDFQAFWKADTTGKLTNLLDGNLSSIILEGARGSTGLTGDTGIGNQGETGLVGVTGAYGGPPGLTGLQGLTGPAGIHGVTGPGLLGYDTFVKTLPMESWRALYVDTDVYSGIPVIKFDSVGVEEIDTTIVVPAEWNQNNNMYLRFGAILNLPLSAGSQLSWKVHYIGFDKTDNIGSLGSYHTDTITHTISSPSQYDFSTISGLKILGIII